MVACGSGFTIFLTGACTQIMINKELKINKSVSVFDMYLPASCDCRAVLCSAVLCCAVLCCAEPSGKVSKMPMFEPKVDKEAAAAVPDKIKESCSHSYSSRLVLLPVLCCAVLCCAEPSDKVSKMPLFEPKVDKEAAAAVLDESEGGSSKAAAGAKRKGAAAAAKGGKKTKSK